MHLGRLIFSSKNNYPLSQSTMKRNSYLFFFWREKQTCVSCVPVRCRRSLVATASSPRLSGVDLGLLTPEAWRWAVEMHRRSMHFPQPQCGRGKTPLPAQGCGAHRRSLSSERCPEFSSSTRRSSHAARECGLSIRSVDRSTANATVLYKIYTTTLTESFGLFLEQNTVSEVQKIDSRFEQRV